MVSALRAAALASARYKEVSWLVVGTCLVASPVGRFPTGLGSIIRTLGALCGVAFVSDPPVPCFRPLLAYPGGPGAPRVVFNPIRSYAGSLAFLLPCGRCIGCRMTRARDWATRMHCEAQMHPASTFLTLTYEDGQLPSDGSISKRTIQLFMKRLRKAVAEPIRYFACGEYGDENWRPHYHAIVFGYGFPDRKPWRMSPTGHPLYRSELLERVWTFGNAEVGEVTHASAGYVARYCLKKLTPTSERGMAHYFRPHPVTGEFHQVAPEFALMSSRPGIGGSWFAEYARDAFPSDFLVIDGSKRPVPTYYKRKLSELEQLVVTSKRKARARENAENSTPERLAVREELQKLRANQLKRTL